MTNEPKAGGSLDPEMLAAYIDKRLPPDERAAVEAKLATDPDSYELLVELIHANEVLTGEQLHEDAAPELVKQPEPQAAVVPLVPRAPRFRGWAIAGGVLAVAAALVLVVRLQPELLQRLRGGEAVDPRFAKLVAAVGEERYIESRVAGGFKYGPLRQPTRGPGRSEANLTLLAAAGEIQRDLEAERTPETLHAWGVAQLMLGNFDEAVRTLEEGLSVAPADPALLTSASGAYIARATQAQRADDWPRALELAIQAQQKSPVANREALFNKALAAQSMNLPVEAARYWTDYLEVETDPEWRRLAEGYRQRLSAAVGAGWKANKDVVMAAITNRSLGDAEVARFPQQLRELVEDELLPSWALAQSRQDPQAAIELERLTTLVSLLAEQTGDRLLLETVQGLEGSRSRAAAARGFLSYKAARTKYENAAVQDSVTDFRDAAARLDEAESPFAGWARLHLAIAAYYRGDYPQSLEILDGLTRQTADHHWPALTARAGWMRGLVRQLRADYRLALVEYEASLSRFVALNETDNISAIHNLIAEVLLYVGDGQSVWTHTVESLTHVTPDMPFRRRHTQLVSAANKSTRLGLLEASLAFTMEASSVATEWNDPLALTEVANYRARTLVRLGRLEEARAALLQARQNLAKVRDPSFKSRIEVEVLQTSADVEAITDPSAGIESASRALAFFAESKSALRTPRLLLARGEARRRLGDLDGAEHDFAQGIRAFEAERERLPHQDLARLGHGDSLWSVYSELLDLQVAKGLPCQSLLATADRGRAVTLKQPARDTGANRVLADGELVIHYAFHESGLQRIVLRGAECHVQQLDVTQPEVTALGAAYRNTLDRHDAAGARVAATTLFRRIIGDDARFLTGVSRLTVVPDGPLHYVPFSSFMNEEGRYLIELVALQISPALTLNRPPMSGAPLRRVVIAGGDVPGSGFGPLPDAARERRVVAKALAAHDPAAVVQSSPSALTTTLEGADLFHFAGHAVANADYPMFSGLLLGPASSHAGGWLTVADLEPLNLRSARLVFLSACSTQAGRLFGGEGPASLARSFLVAGAHQVVATLNPVADGSTAAFVERFYAAWAQDQDAPRAIRRSALDELRVGSPSSQGWPMWIAIGEPGWRLE